MHREGQVPGMGGEDNIKHNRVLMPNNWKQHKNKFKNCDMAT